MKVIGGDNMDVAKTGCPPKFKENIRAKLVRTFQPKKRTRPPKFIQSKLPKPQEKMTCCLQNQTETFETKLQKYVIGGKKVNMHYIAAA